MDWGLAKATGKRDHHDLRISPEASVTAVRSDRREMVESSPDSPLVTMDGTVVGTPAYLAPEAVYAGHDVDARVVRVITWAGSQKAKNAERMQAAGQRAAVGQVGVDLVELGLAVRAPVGDEHHHQGLAVGEDPLDAVGPDPPDPGHGESDGGIGTAAGLRGQRVAHDLPPGSNQVHAILVLPGTLGPAFAHDPDALLFQDLGAQVYAFIADINSRAGN